MLMFIKFSNQLNVVNKIILIENKLKGFWKPLLYHMIFYNIWLKSKQMVLETKPQNKYKCLLVYLILLIYQMVFKTAYKSVV